MKEWAAALDIDPPKATALVDNLESLGFVRRLPLPTDRRAKLSEATLNGERAARMANEMLSALRQG